MLAAMFVSGGIDQVKKPQTKVAQAERVTPALASALHLPEDPATLVRINGAVQIGAASLLALGKMPRLSAIALGASLVPTTLAGHRFWEEHEPVRRTAQRTSFLKNVSMLGGLVLAAADTEGRPSLSWRARRATSKASRRIGVTSHKATDKVGRAMQEIERAARTVEKAAEHAAHKVQDAAETGAQRVAAAVPVGH